MQTMTIVVLLLFLQASTKALVAFEAIFHIPLKQKMGKQLNLNKQNDALAARLALQDSGLLVLGAKLTAEREHNKHKARQPKEAKVVNSKQSCI